MTRAEKLYLIQHHRNLATCDEEDATYPYVTNDSSRFDDDPTRTAKAHRAAIALLRRTKTEKS
jgi:hypothetical protein